MLTCSKNQKSSQKKKKLGVIKIKSWPMVKLKLLPQNL